MVREEYAMGGVHAAAMAESMYECCIRSMRKAMRKTRKRALNEEQRYIQGTACAGRSEDRMSISFGHVGTATGGANCTPMRPRATASKSLPMMFFRWAKARTVKIRPPAAVWVTMRCEAAGGAVCRRNSDWGQNVQMQEVPRMTANYPENISPLDNRRHQRPIREV